MAGPAPALISKLAILDATLIGSRNILRKGFYSCVFPSLTLRLSCGEAWNRHSEGTQTDPLGSGFRGGPVFGAPNDAVGGLLFS